MANLKFEIMGDAKLAPKLYPRSRGASLPSPNGRKDRAPTTCLFRGQDHGDRLLEEFDTLRNLQGKFILYQHKIGVTRNQMII